MRIFDAQQLPLTQALINQYGEKEIKIISEFYGSQKVDEDGNQNFFNNKFSSLYPNTSKIIHIILIIPLSNASIERVFSRQNLIKNKLQNKMKLETLHFYLNILINGPSLDLFDFEAAYNH
ncbi:zinc finger protein 862-like [Rhizophagus irregularis DAOM 181602=DAOM 197198]|nr:zinc finger protein 862-like [Rhizophagus irregularis DAOM 181602=DAOM 197198]